MEPQAASTLPFPSLLIRADGFEARGSFAEAQATYLEPDPATVTDLARLLQAKNVGVVAHFYMDAEVQGTLFACDWPHIHVADSLKMADRAVEMARAGVKSIVVMGVDFMSENVRSMLDASGFQDVRVYRVAATPIGCSLAESAEAPAYGAYLKRAGHTPRSLHVIYVNTSLRVKARAQALVPTITCTSSNVVKLVLQAFAQVPDLHIWFGPDTYMGQNLKHLLEALVDLGDEAIRRLHPDHDAASVRAALERFDYFRQGVCIVHHMFGSRVVEKVRRECADAFMTAHLEVPGEMFELGFAAQLRGEGVVGSTSNILDFIGKKVDEAAAGREPQHLRFVLGTESGMITPIAHRVQDALRAASNENVEAEIIFPVAQEAIAQTGDTSLPIVPGVAAGEGCSTAGGCATCPFMKMNTLDALLDLLRTLGHAPSEELRPFEPATYSETVNGRSLAELGTVSIVHMRDFQRDGELPASLVNDILSRGID